MGNYRGFSVRYPIFLLLSPGRAEQLRAEESNNCHTFRTPRGAERHLSHINLRVEPRLLRTIPVQPADVGTLPGAGWWYTRSGIGRYIPWWVYSLHTMVGIDLPAYHGGYRPPCIPRCICPPCIP